MSAVTKQEIVEALRGPIGAIGNAQRKGLADRIEKHGFSTTEESSAVAESITPQDGRTPVAWAIDTPYGRAYSFADELLGGWPVPDGWVLVPRQLTTAMLLARNSHSWPSLMSDEVEALWDALLAAAPEEMEYEMNDELIKRIKSALCRDEVKEVFYIHELLVDCRAALTKKYLPMTDEQVGKLTVFDGLHHVETPILAKYIRHIEAEVIRRAGLEVSND